MDIWVHNPWWKGREGIKEDEDFRKWQDSKIKWTPQILENVLEAMSPFSVHFIFGPRQVGKTTLIKLLIARLLERKDPKSIFYFRCDQLSDYKELDEVLKKYLKIKDIEKIKSSYIFLDEITFPREWYRTLKWHIDMGNFKNDVIVLSGSLSTSVKGETETFPGRRGHGRDFIMYPLSFREFVRVVNKSIFERLEKLENLDEREIREKTINAMPWLDELNTLFEAYLKCGGFPLSIKSLFERGKIIEEVVITYLSWIKGDIMKLRRSEAITKRVLKALIEKVPSTLSYHSIAKEFEVPSHKTVFQHINLLEKLFLVKVLNFIDPNKGIEVFRKQKKIHFLDPFLYEIFSYWCLTKKPEDPVIVESVVAAHLARKFNIGYWKNSSEVDIMVLHDEKIVGIEVKYRKKAEAARLKLGRMKHMITLSIDRFEDQPLIVPTSIFLALLEV
ncbi:MAG: ATP-binding protein [Candidatus Methanomethylicaceae archaeon]